MLENKENIELNDKQLKSVSGGNGDDLHYLDIGLCYTKETQYYDATIVHYYKIIELMPSKETYKCLHWDFLKKSSCSYAPTGYEILTLDEIKQFISLGRSLPAKCEGQ